MVRTPLQSRTRLGALDCVPDFGVPPVHAILSFLASLVGLLQILAFATILRIILIELLLLEIRNLGGEGNDLGIRSTSFLPTPFSNHIAIKDVEIIDDRVLVGLFACDPGILGRANAQSKASFVVASAARNSLVRSLSSLQKSSPFSALISCWSSSSFVLRVWKLLSAEMMVIFFHLQL
jgi:hypothetical protein